MTLSFANETFTNLILVSEKNVFSTHDNEIWDGFHLFNSDNFITIWDTNQSDILFFGYSFIFKIAMGCGKRSDRLKKGVHEFAVDLARSRVGAKENFDKLEVVYGSGRLSQAAVYKIFAKVKADLAPADFFLFPKCKKELAGVIMKREDVTANLDGVCRTIPIVDFVDAFHAWKRRCEKCI
eukprot:snap_masked-scaffold465_size163580-processed-gene-0.3 protein:Tk03808 transcript:snap_masked-scaffold465_size163580-processed-gene-0.3-mRNA-1 annotation:"mariner mos1 transposase"